MKQALLIIDMQAGLFEPPPAEATHIIQRINQLAHQARQQHIPVFFIQHESEHSASLCYASAGWQLHPQLITAQTDRHIRKTTPDSFLRTDLLEHLQRQQIEQLLICGYATEFCVDTTVRSAAAHGYSVILVSDAHTTHDKPHASAIQIRQHHNATLPEVTSFGPRIQSIESEAIWR